MEEYERGNISSRISARKQRYLARKHYFGSITRILENKSKTFLPLVEQLKIRKVIKVRETRSWLISLNSSDSDVRSKIFQVII